jgi:hypothetical protein
MLFFIQEANVFLSGAGMEADGSPARQIRTKRPHHPLLSYRKVPDTNTLVQEPAIRQPSRGQAKN